MTELACRMLGAEPGASALPQDGDPCSPILSKGAAWFLGEKGMSGVIRICPLATLALGSSCSSGTLLIFPEMDTLRPNEV